MALIAAIPVPRETFVLIRLEIGEVSTAYAFAALRQVASRAAGGQNLKAGPQGALQTEVDGVLGEFAVAKALNIMPDVNCSIRAGSADMTWRGYRLDVKATRYRTGRLLTHRASADIDVYVLAVINDEQHINVAGWCEPGALILPANVAAELPGKPYALPQEALRSMSELGACKRRIVAAAD